MSANEGIPTTRLSAAEVTAFIEDVFPGAMENFVVEEVRPMYARIPMLFKEFRLRPGGTISGPSLMRHGVDGRVRSLACEIGPMGVGYPALWA